MKIPKFNFSNKYIFEFFSIAIAVFLGFMLNSVKEDYQHRKSVDDSIEDIFEEIKLNHQDLKKIVSHHQDYQSKVDTMLPKIDTSLMYDLNVKFKMLSYTAWSTCKLTKSIVYMDLKTARMITDLYEYQKTYMDLISSHLKDELDNIPNEDDYVELRNRLYTASNLMKIMIPIEKELLQYYEDIIDYFQKLE
ncbi:MAG: hypothetical protein N4A49_06955 [Marinifilaceae bacterium]|jgi:hypothetical protein|nr:hypothetical protein [Marinifilaceae bacterium]